MQGNELGVHRPVMVFLVVHILNEIQPTTTAILGQEAAHTHCVVAVAVDVCVGIDILDQVRTARAADGARRVRSWRPARDPGWTLGARSGGGRCPLALHSALHTPATALRIHSSCRSSCHGGQINSLKIYT